MIYKIHTLGVLLFSILFLNGCNNAKPSIKIGILHSLTGTMTLSEKGLVDSMLMAVEEINNNSGLLGRKVEAIVVDGASDAAVFADQAETLIVDESVVALFACWTSSCRKSIKPIVEKHNNLLFYPVQFEGLEESNHIIYTGASPNQQVIPALSWLLQHLGQKPMLIGSDYVFPRTVNRLIRSMVYMKGYSLAGELYVPLGGIDMDNLMQKIKEKKPDVLINSINGDSNHAFFRALKEHGIDDIPVMSFSISEPEIEAIGEHLVEGHYLAGNYFQSLSNTVNDDFKQRFLAKYGEHRKIGDAMVSAYLSVKLWAQAVKSIKETHPLRIRKALDRKSINGPGGIVSIDPNTGYSWKNSYIGQIQQDGQVQIVWRSSKPTRPLPYPIIHSKKEWKVVTERLSDKQ